MGTTDRPICGNCIHYHHSDEHPYCKKGKKQFGYLQMRPCYEGDALPLPPKPVAEKKPVAFVRTEPHKWENGIELKKCKVCGEWKTLDKFYPRKDTRDNLQGRCKACQQEVMKEFKRMKRNETT